MVETMGGSWQASTAGLADDGSVERVVTAAWSAHGDRLRRVLASVTRDATAAEDLVQDAFVRLSIEVRAGRTPDNVGAWLHRVGVNLATSRGRRLAVASRKLAGQTSTVTTEQTPESVVIDGEHHRALRAVLAELPQGDREALLLAAYGYRGPEIAHRLGRTEGATRTLLCRARARMRTRLVALGVGP